MSAPDEASVSDDSTTAVTVDDAPVVSSSRAWVALSVVAPLVTLAVHAYVVWGTKWPAFPFDEVSLLQMSRMIAGDETPALVRGPGYFPGWSVVIAPVWWFTQNPSVAYQASLWIGVGVSMITIWPLSRVLTRYGLAVAPSVVVASFVMLLPARAVQADFSMSERLLVLALVGAFLAAQRLVERPTVVRHLVFAVALGLMLFTHVRMLVVIAAAVVWLVMRLVRPPRVPTIVGIVGVLAAGYLANWAGRAMNEALMGRPFTQGDSLMDKVAASRPSLFLRVGIGQSWYQSLASYGIVLVGVLVVLVLVWRQLRRLEVAADTFLLGSTVAIVLISMAQWANDYLLFDNPWVRLDAWVYGRYIDPLATILTGVGAAFLLRGISRAMTRWVFGLTIVTALAAIAVLTPQVPTWGFVTPAHIPGVLAWEPLLPHRPWPREDWIIPSLTNANRIWIIAPLCVLLVLTLAKLLRRRGVLLAGLLCVLAAVGTVVATPRTHAFHERESGYVGFVEQVQSINRLDPQPYIGNAQDFCPRGGNASAVADNYFGYGALPSILRGISADQSVTTDIVIACNDWMRGRRIGALPVKGVGHLDSRIWILPGSLQDELARQGRLDP